MRIDGKRGRGAAWVLTALLGLWFAPAPVAAQAASYMDYDDLTRELRSLVNDSDIASLESLGTSHEGRDIWMVRIAATGEPLSERPGVLVVGNLSGDHLVGSALAVETIRYLLSADVDLSRRVVYVVPRLNPDGAEAMFADLRWDRRGNALPFDDDNDGRVDEDGPNDLNGDGVITVMRVPDPEGVYMVAPDDERLMKVADAAEGEVGAYTLYWEGTDDDGDGFIAEDGPGGVDLDRSFQHAYPYWERDAGPYMVSEPEARALMDFTIAHRNIAAILTFGHSDNLVTPPDSRGNLAAAVTLELPDFAAASNAEVFDVGVFRAQQSFGGFGGFGGGPQLRGAQLGRDNDPSSGRRPSTTVHRSDQEYFSVVSEAYREITGITEVPLNREAAGAFFQYGYFQFGVPSFSTPGWALPSAESEGEGEARPGGGGRGGAAAGGDARILAAFDATDVAAFVPWTPFQHPELGSVEIGGFRPYAVSNPPAAMVQELGAKHGEFVAHLVGLLPSVRIADTEVVNHGGGVFTVTVEVANEGFLPTSLAHGQVSRSVQPTTVQIQVPPEAVLTGDPKTSRIAVLEGSGRRQSFSWVVQAREGSTVEIRVRAQKAGTETATVTLR